MSTIYFNNYDDMKDAVSSYRPKEFLINSADEQCDCGRKQDGYIISDLDFGFVIQRLICCGRCYENQLSLKIETEMENILKYTKDEKLEAIISYPVCHTERTTLLRYLLAVRNDDHAQIAYFENFGNRVCQIIVNVRTYERGLLFGLQHFKLMAVALTPFGRNIVSSNSYYS